MTESDGPSVETKVSIDRPVDWPLWRRLRFFGGVALLCTAGAVSIELLLADIHGGRAVNVYDSVGWTELRPTLWSEALSLPAVGLMFAVALPLYRKQYGGVFVGLLGYLAFLAGAIAGGMIGARHHSGPSSWDTLEIIQALVGFIVFGVIAVVGAQEGRSMALGEPDDGSSWSWPSW